MIKIKLSLITPLLLFLFSTSGFSIEAPDTLTYYRLSRIGVNEVAEFSFSSKDTGYYAIVIMSTWGDAALLYNGTRIYAPHPDLKRYEIDSNFTTKVYWVYFFHVDVSTPVNHVFGIKDDPPGIVLDGFYTCVTRAHRIEMTSRYQTSLHFDTTMYVPDKVEFLFPEISIEKGKKFDHWSVDSGNGKFSDTKNPYGPLTCTSDLKISRHLIDWKLPVLSTGKDSISIVTHGVNGYASAGIYFRFDAPLPGYYGYRIGRMVYVSETRGDSCPETYFSRNEWVWNDLQNIFKDSINNLYSVLVSSDRGSLLDPSPFYIEIQEAPFTLSIDSTPNCTLSIDQKTPRFVPGWESNLRIKVNSQYRLDSLKAIKGKATLDSISREAYKIFLQDNATIKAFVSESPVFPLTDKWQIRDFKYDQWNDQHVRFSFKPSTPSKYTLTAFVNDSIQRLFLLSVTSPVEIWSGREFSGTKQVSYTFTGNPDSTFFFCLYSGYNTPCSQFAITIRPDGANLSDKPILCDFRTSPHDVRQVKTTEPLTGTFNRNNLYIKGISKARIRLYNLNGTSIKIRQQHIADDLWLMLPENIGRGMYILFADYEEKTIRQKIIIR